MKTRAMLLVSLFASFSLFAQSFTGASVRSVDARAGVAQAIGSGDGWYAWSVPMVEGGTICCWNNRQRDCCGSCTLGTSNGWSMTTGDEHDLRPTTDVTIALHLEDGVATRVQLFDSNCAVSATGKTINVLQNVDPASSIAWLADQARHHRGGHGNSVIGALAQHRHPNMMPALERLAGNGSPSKVREDALFWIGQRGGERGFQYLRNFLRNADEGTSLRKKAVFSLSQNKSDGAVPALIELARHDKSDEIRRESIFWLGQRAGEKAAGELRRFVDEDPDDDVREHAVFAISQLPRERSVPMLVDLAKNHKSAAVRKKAIFWLTQTGDQRAIDVIEEILQK